MIQQLHTRIVEKPWGKRGIDKRFGASPDIQVGEIWFEPPTGHPLDVMAKYLFTTERLSIQVHPDDSTARERGFQSGKDECWIILEADENAELGIGTVPDLSPGDIIEAARDGSIVDLVDWRKPVKGDFIFNPAGTIHALGPGLTVLEIQQALDLTYRLYDYGRPRELHLEEAADVVRAGPHRCPLDGKVGSRSRSLIDGSHFGAAWCIGTPPVMPEGIGDIQLLPIDETVAGIAPGQCALVDREVAAGLSSRGSFVLAWTAVGRE